MTFDEAKKFVITWYATKTLAEFCFETGLDRRWASNKAAHFRRMGIPLPSKPNTNASRKKQLTRSQVFELKLLAQNEAAKIEADKYRKQTRMNGSLESLKNYVKELIGR